jgi:hypothetical protein
MCERAGNYCPVSRPAANGQGAFFYFYFGSVEEAD